MTYTSIDPQAVHYAPDTRWPRSIRLTHEQIIALDLLAHKRSRETGSACDKSKLVREFVQKGLIAEGVLEA